MTAPVSPPPVRDELDALVPDAPPPGLGKRSRRRRLAGGTVLLAAVAAGAGIYAGSGSSQDAPPAPTSSAATRTVAVEQRDLVDRESVNGTLGYADRGTLAAGVSGTLTRLRRDGSTVGRGGWLYEVDGERTGWLLYGRRPAWRDFTPSMSDGADVRQLESNLRALGHEPGEVDGDWTWETTAAVKRFQKARGLTQDGSLGKGELAFRRGAVRLGEAKMSVGQSVQAGTALMEVTSTRREVKVDLEAGRQDLARQGAKVTVTLPNGKTVKGRVSDVGSVAKQAGEGKDPTIEVRVVLAGKAARRGGLDQAPVDVGFERERAKGALTVPVTALIARPGGGYAVEVEENGRRRLVPVKPGLTADGMVAVTGDLRAGQRVVVPA